MRNEFAYLKKLGFTESNGLVLRLEMAKNNQERLYFQEAQSLGADAVFFRRFYKADTDGNLKSTPYQSLPAVCIFQKDDTFFNTQPHKELHAALWSAGKIEVYIIQGDTRIDIINARQPAERVKGKHLSLKNNKLHLIDAALKTFNDHRFSAHLFSSGTFWEQPGFKDKISSDRSPYLFLLRYLMQAREQLSTDQTIKLPPSSIDKLLITSILIKFLEEIKDDDGKHTLKEIYSLHQIDSFDEALKQGKCNQILDELAKEFNGKVFNTFTDEERQIIDRADLMPIAHFLTANIDLATKQMFLWEQYDFKFLPAETISALYETFVQAEAARKYGKTEKGVVYTPIHLVNLMVDEAMPLERSDLFEDNQFKVLDPACGSGVFLVAAYKRLLQWWAINNYKKTHTISYPGKKVAQKILEDNIYGVDIVDTAVLVSIFGLTTALLDKLAPKEIWNNLKFQDLSERNIQQKNFSDWAKGAKSRNEKYDLVIGNPPFNKSLLGDFTNDDFNELFNKQVPGNKLALKFLEAALHFGDKVCMIIPSNILLYNRSTTAQKYRSELFTNHTVHKIYDFTHLRESLFQKKSHKGFGKKKKTGRTPVVAIVAKSYKHEYDSIEHIVVKRELFSDKGIRFEIDYYDRHTVRWEWAIDEKKQFIWKTNLLGGGRLFHLIYRLSLLESFSDFIFSRKKEKNSWTYGVGYKVNGRKKEKNVDYIHKKPSIVTHTFNEQENFEIFIETERDFAEPRDPRLYKPPHIIFKSNIGKNNIPIHFSEKYLCFKDRLIGLHAPAEDKDVLLGVYNIFQEEAYSKLSRLWIYATSAETIVNLETACKKEDIDSLPFPADNKYIQLNENEKIIRDDVLKYLIHLGKAINKKNSAGRVLHTPPDKSGLKEFSSVFCETLNKLYAKDGKSWQAGEVLQNDTFISYQFGFGDDNGLENKIIESSNNIMPPSLPKETNKNQGAIYQRIIRHYVHVDGYDCIYLIKPNTRRYWLPSIALRDADDTFMDLKKAGY